MYLTKWRGYTKPLQEFINSIKLIQTIEDFHGLYLNLLQPYLAGAQV